METQIQECLHEITERQREIQDDHQRQIETLQQEIQAQFEQVERLRQGDAAEAGDGR